MTYYNPIFRMQTRKFFETAKASGVDGVIVPDLPIEEADEYKKYADDNEIDTVFLAAPSTSASRLKEILKYSSGFLYLVSVFGVTGARKRVEAATLGLIENTLSITRGRIPLSVGFGISEPEHVKTVLQNGADAAIVGSGFVKVVETERNKERKMLETLKEYASQLKEATKSTGKN
jgi:tryptophan synthase alpha chain